MLPSLAWRQIVHGRGNDRQGIAVIVVWQAF